MEAMNKSRTKPVTREARVMSETVEADLKSDTPRSVATAPSAWPQLLARLRKKTAALVIMLGFAGNIHKPIKG
jgi:hypothetical protein